MTPIDRIERWVFIYSKIEYMKKGKAIDRVVVIENKELGQPRIKSLRTPNAA